MASVFLSRRSLERSCKQHETSASISAAKCTVLIIPGIGIGHTMYLTLLKTVRAQLPNRNIFLIEVPQVNVRTPWNEGWGEAMNPREFQKAVRNLLLVHGFPPGTPPEVPQVNVRTPWNE